MQHGRQRRHTNLGNRSDGLDRRSGSHSGGFNGRDCLRNGFDSRSVGGSDSRSCGYVGYVSSFEAAPYMKQTRLQEDRRKAMIGPLLTGGAAEDVQASSPLG
jgi:hypothetical protein